MSIAKGCLDFTGLYEAELLVELMLRFWKHPMADDKGFRTIVLEQAAESLQQAVMGTACLDELSAENTNFVAAVWCAEQVTWIDEEEGELAKSPARKRWRADVIRSIPSCFVDPGMLDSASDS